MGNDTFEFEEENIFSDDEFKMVMSIVKRGFETEVLEAAKAAGHFGAFIMQAKGVSKIQRKFFGFSIDPCLYIFTFNQLIIGLMLPFSSSVSTSKSFFIAL